MLLLKLRTSSVKLLPFPVRFSNSHIWLVLFIHHFASAIKPLQNLLSEVLVKHATSSPSFTHSHAAINLRVHQPPGRGCTDRCPCALSQTSSFISHSPSSCRLAQRHFIKIAAHRAFNGTAPHTLQNNSAHQCYPASLALSF